MEYLPGLPQDTKNKFRVFYGQEPSSGESTTTECGVNYQLLAVITEVAQWGTPGCSRPQPATDNGARDGRSNWLVAPPTRLGSTPTSSTYCTVLTRPTNRKTCCTNRDSNVRPRVCQNNALPVQPLRVYTKPLRSCSGNRVQQLLLKSHLGIKYHYNITRSSDSFSTVPPIVNAGDFGCIVHDLETILVLLAFNFIPQKSHRSLTSRWQLRDSATVTLTPGDGTTASKCNHRHNRSAYSPECKKSSEV